MNPFDPPKEIPVPEAARTPGLTPRRFRWFVVAAALSWCFGGASLIAWPFGVYHTIGMLPISSDAGWPERLLVNASLVMIPALIVSGCLNIVAGLRWLRGRWVAGLVCNGIAFALLAVPQIMHEAALAAFKQI